MTIDPRGIEVQCYGYRVNELKSRKVQKSMNHNKH